MRGAFRSFRRRVNYEEYGGVPLLGVNGAAIICHGRSSPRAIQNAVRVAGEFVRNQVNDRIRTEMARLPRGLESSVTPVDQATEREGHPG